MPPKGKGKKKENKKPDGVVDGLSTAEMSKDQLWEHFIHLREELDRVREEKGFFKLERDKLQASWEISKKGVEETEAKLRNKRQQREEAAERHRVEISLYKQKLKHVLSEQHGAVSERKLDGLASSWQVQNRNAQKELVLRQDVQGLQADRREKELHSESHVKELKLKQQVELKDLNNHYERQLRAVEVKYHHQAQAITQAAINKRVLVVEEVRKQKEELVASLMKDHDTELREAEEKIFSAENLKQGQLTELTKLRELQCLEKQESWGRRELAAAKQENRRLTEELQQLQQQPKEPVGQQNRDAMARQRARLKQLDEELRDATVKHELLLQAVQQVRRECEELRRRQAASLLGVQQRSGLRRLQLEAQMAEGAERLERKEVQLDAALSVSSADAAARQHAAARLDQILESKRTALQKLQEELDRECQEYEQLRHSCEEKGQFRSAKQILKSARPQP
ncbi:dynein regulatory complex subunit 4-like isoform 2-T2 [Menidia menidia]